MQNIFIAKQFCPLPLQTSKNSAPPFFFCHDKFRVNPIEKHVSSIFTDKFVVVKFFQVPPYKGQKF